MSGYKQAFESSIIVSVGLLMHLNRVSIIELQYSKLPMLKPNAASSLFVFSVLCIFSRLRPLWPQTLRRPHQFLVFLVELALILYATDLLLRQIWLPCLKVLNFLCHFLGQYIVVANQNFLTYNAPTLSGWIRNDAFYIVRFLLAVVSFIFMLDATGIIESMQAKVFHTIKEAEEFSIDDMPLEEKESNNNISEPLYMENVRSAPFDVYDLPYVPQEDLLNLGHRVGARRRKQPVRKTKQNAKLLLNDAASEEYC